MKKTLIAVAVAVSTVIPCSAMAAWTANGVGGTVEFSGTLTPKAIVTPWEVQVGNAVTGLDTLIKKGQSSVNVSVVNPIPILGIRTQAANPFTGRSSGISPQIDYNQAVDLNNFKMGVSTLTLDVKDGSDIKIGTMRVNFYAGAVVSQKGASDSYWFPVVADNAGEAFFGGVTKSSGTVSADVIGDVTAIDPDFTANYTDQGVRPWNNTAKTNFGSVSHTYSAFYGSGIRAGEDISITLDSAVTNDIPIDWKANLPITVSYQ